MNHLRDDFRYAVRKLAGSPGFSLLAILILALGTGASTAVFSVVNAALLRPLPGVGNPSRLVTFYRTQKGDSFDNFGYPDYRDFRDRSRTLSGLAARSGTMLSVRYGTAERLRGDLVTGNYFQVLGVKPAVGRLLLPDDDRTGTDAAVAVLGYGLWQRRFGGRPDAVGSRIDVNGFPFTVVGVVPREFGGTVTGAAFDLWVPLASQPQTIPRLSTNILENRAAGWIDIFGRLQPEMSVEQAGAEMKTIAQQLAQAYPNTNGSRSVGVFPGLGWYPDDRAEAGSLLRLLAAAVALLALIACANLAGLFMVRASGRQREIAVRLAVGAGRGRLVRLQLAEGVVVALAAGVLGLLFSEWAAGLMASIRPSSAERNLDVSLDARVLCFALAASTIACVLFALLPALRSVPADLTAALRHGSAGAGARRTRLRSVLMAAQVAVSFILLSAAGLLAGNLRQVLSDDPGYETANVAMGSLDLTLQRYPEQRGLAVYRQLLERLAGLPGVTSATLASTVPPAGFPERESIFHPEEEPSPDVFLGRSFELGLRVDINRVAPRYFETLGIRVVAGRDFTARDQRGTPQVAIINRALAERMWPGQNPIGKLLAWPLWGGPRRPTFEVVGLAADTRSRSLESPAVPLLYVPLLQNYSGRTRLVVRTRSNPSGALQGFEQTVAAVDSDLALYGTETMGRHVAQSLWAQRLAMGWIGAFSLTALALTAIGLYGVMAQSIAQRGREVGIRMALGAAPGSVSRLVVQEGMRLALAGIGAGLPVSLALSGALRGFLTVTRSRSVTPYFGAAILLAMVLLAACWIPARRAARVDPVQALRTE
jgi:putative ABC transport system permease protein